MAVAFGVGGAGLVLGSIFGALALDASSDFDETPATTHADRAERLALVSDASFGVGVVGTLTGLVILLLGDDGDAPEPARRRARLVPSAAGGQAGASAAWTF